MVPSAATVSAAATKPSVSAAKPADPYAPPPSYGGGYAQHPIASGASTNAAVSAAPKSPVPAAATATTTAASPYAPPPGYGGGYSQHVLLPTADSKAAPAAYGFYSSVSANPVAEAVSAYASGGAYKVTASSGSAASYDDPAYSTAFYLGTASPPQVAGAVSPAGQKVAPPLPALPASKAGAKPAVDPTAVALIKSAARDWNGEYQAATDELHALLKSTKKSADHANAIYAVRCRLFKIVDEFTALASQLAQRIICEAAVPQAQKSIPAATNAGGAAGGEKFRVGGVFLKRATDEHGYYGGLECAMGIANHELKGARAYANVRFDIDNVLSTPLMAVIDYAGFRVTAMGTLPISGSSSLVYGSANAGSECDVVASPPVVDFMKAAGKQLGLKEHRVGPLPSSSRFKQLSTPKEKKEAAMKLSKLVASCVDIEVHRSAPKTDAPTGTGATDRFYLLDTARVFPPQPARTHLEVMNLPADLMVPLSAVRIEKNKSIEYCRRQMGITGPPKAGEPPFGPNARIVRLQQMRSAYLIYSESPNAKPNPRATELLLTGKISGPALVITSDAGSHLNSLFRPEFVRYYARAKNVALSSDAHTMFGHHDHATHNRDVNDAYYHLINSVIPKLAADIISGSVLLHDGRHAVQVMHERGINVRFMGRLRMLLPAPRTRDRGVLMTEMVARCVKNTVRDMLRAAMADFTPPVAAAASASGAAAAASTATANDEISASVRTLLVARVTEQFNLLFGTSAVADRYWRTELMCRLTEKFGAGFAVTRADVEWLDSTRATIRTGGNDDSRYKEAAARAEKMGARRQRVFDGLRKKYDRSNPNAPNDTTRANEAAVTIPDYDDDFTSRVPLETDVAAVLSGLPDGSDPIETVTDIDPRVFVDLGVLLERLQTTTGVTFRTSTVNKFLSSPILMLTDKPFVAADFVGLRAKSKRIEWESADMIRTLQVHAAAGAADTKSAPAAVAVPPNTFDEQSVESFLLKLRVIATKADELARSVTRPAPAGKLAVTVWDELATAVIDASKTDKKPNATPAAKKERRCDAWVELNALLRTLPPVAGAAEDTKLDIDDAALAAHAAGTIVNPAERLPISDLRIAVHWLRFRIARAELRAAASTLAPDALTYRLVELHSELLNAINTFRAIYGNAQLDVRMGTSQVKVKRGHMAWYMLANAWVHVLRLQSGDRKTLPGMYASQFCQTVTADGPTYFIQNPPPMSYDARMAVFEEPIPVLVAYLTQPANGPSSDAGHKEYMEVRRKAIESPPTAKDELSRFNRTIMEWIEFSPPARWLEAATVPGQFEKFTPLTRAQVLASKEMRTRFTDVVDAYLGGAQYIDKKIEELNVPKSKLLPAGTKVTGVASTGVAFDPKSPFDVEFVALHQRFCDWSRVVLDAVEADRRPALAQLLFSSAPAAVAASVSTAAPIAGTAPSTGTATAAAATTGDANANASAPEEVERALAGMRWTTTNRRNYSFYEWGQFPVGSYNVCHTVRTEEAASGATQTELIEHTVLVERTADGDRSVLYHVTVAYDRQKMGGGDAVAAAALKPQVSFREEPIQHAVNEPSKKPAVALADLKLPLTVQSPTVIGTPTPEQKSVTSGSRTVKAIDMKVPPLVFWTNSGTKLDYETILPWTQSDDAPDPASTKGTGLTVVVPCMKVSTELIYSSDYEYKSPGYNIRTKSDTAMTADTHYPLRFPLDPTSDDQHELTAQLRSIDTSVMSGSTSYQMGDQASGNPTLTNQRSRNSARILGMGQTLNPACADWIAGSRGATVYGPTAAVGKRLIYRASLPADTKLDAIATSLNDVYSYQRTSEPEANPWKMIEIKSRSVPGHTLRLVQTLQTRTERKIRRLEMIEFGRLNSEQLAAWVKAYRADEAAKKAQ